MYEKEIEKLADEAYENHNLLSRLCTSTEAYNLEIGRLLYEINKAELYKNLGYDTFNSYIAQPEFHLSRAMAYMYKHVWERFVIELGIDPKELAEAGISKLQAVLPFAEPNNAADLISKAKGLSRSDLKAELDEMFETEKRPSKGLYIVLVEGEYYGKQYYMVVKAESLTMAKEEAEKKYYYTYRREYERLAENAKPPNGEIIFDNNGVSQPIEITT